MSRPTVRVLFIARSLRTVDELRSRQGHDDGLTLTVVLDATSMSSKKTGRKSPFCHTFHR